MEQGEKNGLIYIKLILTALFWSGIFIAGKSLAKNVGPFSVAFIRFVMTSFCLVLLTIKTESKLPRLKRDMYLPIILLGMTGIFAYNFFFFKALHTIQASRASVIIATTPVFIALFSSLFFRETLTRNKIFGILISLTGTVTVISKGRITQIFAGDFGSGELYIFACVIFWTTYSLIGKKTMSRLSPLVCVTYASLVGMVALLLPACFEGMLKDLAIYTIKDWLYITYIAFFGTVLGFVWFYEGVNKIGPTKAGLFINFVPVFAVTLAIVILKEPATVSLLIGAVLVCSGTYLVNKAPTPKKHKKEQLKQEV